MCAVKAPLQSCYITRRRVGSKEVDRCVNAAESAPRRHVCSESANESDLVRLPRRRVESSSCEPISRDATVQNVLSELPHGREFGHDKQPRPVVLASAP